MKKHIQIIVILSIFLTYGVLNSQTLNGSFDSKFKRYQKNESFEGTPNRDWNTVAWKGDRIQKQIVLWSTSNISGLSYTVSNLTKGSDQIASSNVKLRFGKYIKGDPEARSCSEYSTHPAAVEIIDALSDDAVTSLSSLDPLKVWVTIDVPNTTVAGVYTGTITVNGGASPLIFNIVLNVVNYTLPDVANWNFHLDLWQFPISILNLHNNELNTPNDNIALWSDEHFALFEPGYKLLANYGQKAITTYIKEGALGGASMVKWTKKTNGTWEYDYTVFDKYVDKLTSWGISKQIDCFSPIGWNKNVIPYWDEATGNLVELSAPIGSAAYNERWDHFLTNFKIHLDSKGWFNKTVLYMDEVPEAELTPVINLIHANNSNWKIGLAHTGALSPSVSNSLYDASGILPYASASGRTGKITTFYTSCTQTIPNDYITPQNSVSEMTWMGWHSLKENYSGYLRWAYDNWQLKDALDARDGGHTAGDFHLVYRSSNVAPIKYLASLRMESLRDGIQDYEKVNILKTALNRSSDPFDKEALDILNESIAQFGKESGLGAAVFIPKAQQLINDIVTGNIPACKVYGGATQDYYVKSLTTTNGTSNINFSTNSFPSNGYEHHSASKVSGLPGATITLNLGNSTASNCARTKVWVDWNDDDDFSDTGEEVYASGAFQSCSNAINQTIPVTIPANAISGSVHRIRIQVRNSSDPDPVSCGTNDKTGTADFDLEVLDPYCAVRGTGAYNANKVLTTGGNTNIDYAGASGSNNYVSSTEKIRIAQSKVFNLLVTNSNGWSRSVVWIDWNGDGDFGDVGERLTPLSPEKVTVGSTPAYTINITVPETAELGMTKMRIITGDAWTYQDNEIPNTPCGIPTPDGTLENAAIKDFRVEITSSLGLNDLNSKDDIRIYPNPVKGKLTIQYPGINTYKANVFFINAIGQIVYSKQYLSFQSPATMTLPDSLKKGVYILKISTENKSFTHKLIIN